MKKKVKFIIKLVDQRISRYYLKLFQEKNALIIFYFHGLFRDQKEIDSNIVNPYSHRGLTVEYFSQLVEYFLTCNYTFVSPPDILNGLKINKKYIMLTFDDGYFNNQNALPILKRYKIPAVFFISANHIKYNKCFWGDVLYRERIKLGMPIQDISCESRHLKSKTSIEIEKYIIDNFGEKALKPISDIDRPFSPKELKAFSKEKYVYLGNHTNDHAILPNYSNDAIKSQIIGAQNNIYEITGIRPSIIAYPNGKYSDEVVRLSKEIGLNLGLTIDSNKNYLPIYLEGDVAMRLGRFDVQGNDNLIRQCEAVRSDIAVYRMMKALLKY